MRHLIQVEIATQDGDRTVTAYWERDGLAVTPSVEVYKAGWAVTHCGSGYRLLGMFVSKDVAKSVAIRMLALGDWTRDKKTTQSDKVLSANFKAFKTLIQAEGLL